MCCHTEIEVADQTVHLTQYTDTGQTSPNAYPHTPGASIYFTGMTRPGKIPKEKTGMEARCAALEADALAIWPTRRPFVKWLPCQAAGVIRSKLGLVGLVLGGVTG